MRQVLCGVPLVVIVVSNIIAILLPVWLHSEVERCTVKGGYLNEKNKETKQKTVNNPTVVCID